MNKKLDISVKRYDNQKSLDAIWLQIVRDTMSYSHADEVCAEIEKRRAAKTAHMHNDE